MNFLNQIFAINKNNFSKIQSVRKTDSYATEREHNAVILLDRPGDK